MIDDKNILGWLTRTGAIISVHDYQYLTDRQKSECKPITKEYMSNKQKPLTYMGPNNKETPEQIIVRLEHRLHERRMEVIKWNKAHNKLYFELKALKESKLTPHSVDGGLLKFTVWDKVNNRESRIAHYINQDGLLYTDCDPHGVDMSGKRTIRVNPNYELREGSAPQEPKQKQKLFYRTSKNGEWLRCYAKDHMYDYVEYRVEESEPKQPSEGQGRHLKMDCYINGPKGHPQDVMKSLGITYQMSTPQSMYEQWWFWNCENVPEKLPSYLSELKVNPFEAIGYGLSKEDAENITRRVSEGEGAKSPDSPNKAEDNQQG